MRIISGSAKGRSLIAPKGNATRPTQDYIREALFNIISAYVEDAVCADLFGGTGALGLESISRYARFCYFSDKNYTAYNCIKQNVSNLKFEDKCFVLKGNFNKLFEKIQEDKEKLDLVFIDPPYAFENIRDIFLDMKNLNILANNAIIVLERDKSSQREHFDEFELIMERNYGISNISIYEYNNKK